MRSGVVVGTSGSSMGIGSMPMVVVDVSGSPLVVVVVASGFSLWYGPTPAESHVSTFRTNAAARKKTSEDTINIVVTGG